MCHFLEKIVVLVLVNLANVVSCSKRQSMLSLHCHKFKYKYFMKSIFNRLYIYIYIYIYICCDIAKLHVYTLKRPLDALYIGLCNNIAYVGATLKDCAIYSFIFKNVTMYCTIRVTLCSLGGWLRNIPSVCL